MRRTLLLLLLPLLVSCQAAKQDSASTQTGLIDQDLRPDEDLAAAVAAKANGDHATAVRIFRSLADKGNAIAQNELGVMYALGLGVKKNDAAAVKWYRKAANQGHSDGQANLGLMYGTGRGVSLNVATAVKWLRSAADQGNAFAQWLLAHNYARGIGVPQDYAEAKALLRKAALQGQPDAQYDLARMLLDAVPADETEAMVWLQKAARQGSARAQGLIAEMYFEGRGVSQDDVQAYVWYASARNRAVIVEEQEVVLHAATQLNVLAARMTPEQLAEVEELVRLGIMLRTTRADSH